MTRIRSIILSTIVGLVLVAALGYVAEVSYRTYLFSENAHTGRLVSVNGRETHIYCEGNGAPTVILENGLGTTSPYWAETQARIANKHRVCAYDRPGIMWSEPFDYTPSSLDYANNLHELLLEAGESGPFILVGHSLGGLLIRSYARQFPHEVSALVFVDSSHPDQVQRYESIYGPAPSQYWSLKADYVLASIGYIRLKRIIDGKYSGLYNQFYPSNLPAFIQESQTWNSFSESAAALESVGSMPLIVIAAEESVAQLSDIQAEGMTDNEIVQWNEDVLLWHELQTEISTLSSAGELRVSRGSSHMVPEDNPASIAEAVEDIAKRIK